MRVPGQKFFVPAIVFLFAGMARSYNFCGFFAGSTCKG